MFRVVTFLGLVWMGVGASRLFSFLELEKLGLISPTALTFVPAGVSLEKGPSASLLPKVMNVHKVDAVETLHRACPLVNTSQREKTMRQEMIVAVEEATQLFDIDAALLLAMIVVESQCKSNARSPRGAMGLMQITAGTAQWLGLNRPYAVRENILAGAQYIATLMDEFDGNIEFALAAYNAGPTVVRKWSRIPAYRETKQYVTKVMDYYRKFQPIYGQRQKETNERETAEEIA